MPVLAERVAANDQELKIDEEFKELIPPLTDDEYKLLENSILTEGLREPILVWNGIIIDGHNRYEICKKHNLPIFTKEISFSSRDEALLWILNNQLGRRNLTPYQKAKLALAKGKLLEKEARARQLSKLKHVNESIVFQNSEKREDNGKFWVHEQLEKEFGISHDTLNKVKKIEEKAPEPIKEKLERGELSIHRAYLLVKKIEQEEERDKIAEQGKDVDFDGENPKLINADFRDLELEPESVDLILTDPPYGRDYLELWRDLGKLAKRVLKPSGFLVAYSGQAYLVEKMNYLAESLQYYWTFALYHKGNKTALISYLNLANRWKPILVFQKPPFKRLERFCSDYIISEREEKDGHEWQQNEKAAKELIEIFSKAGDVVLDPMMGSGTFPYAAYQLGRKVIGVEIDERSFNIAKARWKK